MGNAERISQYRKNRRNNLLNLFGKKCCLCGYNKCDAALEFHHINPKEKSYAISSGNCHSIQQDLKEVKKCILVCANCHRQIHNNLYQDVDLFQYQNISLAIQTQLLEKEKKEYICKNCGIAITQFSRSGLCTSCAQSLRYRHRIGNKPSREQLKKLIREKSFTEIGQIYGITDNAVRKWCDKMDLPRTKKAINKYTNEQWIKI